MGLRRGGHYQHTTKVEQTRESQNISRRRPEVREGIKKCLLEKTGLLINPTYFAFDLEYETVFRLEKRQKYLNGDRLLVCPWSGPQR